VLRLDEIRERKVREAEALGEIDIRNVRPSTRDFAYYVATDRRDVTLIPELKRRDPWGRPIPSVLDFAALAHEAEDAGALAFAVATDGDTYGGGERDLSTVARAAGVPVLQIDFPMRENQIYRARLLGADSTLLDTGLLDVDEIAALLDVGRHVHMECAALARDESGVERAVASGARILVLESRDPAGGASSRAEFFALLARVPQRMILIVRGGVATAEDVAALQGKVDGALIGCAFLAAPDPVEFLSILLES
jgi:indole-3-glycerol phosphate synthase